MQKPEEKQKGARREREKNSCAAEGTDGKMEGVNKSEITGGSGKAATQYGTVYPQGAVL